MKNNLPLVFGILVFLTPHLQAAETFRLIHKDTATSLYYKGNEKVVETALEMLIGDSKRVTQSPFIRTENKTDQTVIVGIPDKEPSIRELAAKYHLDISGLIGKWEAYKIEVVQDADQSYLFVLGSDPRGTAYGVLELSRQIGVTPWVWWADAAPEMKTDVTFSPDGRVHAPSVQYRGIFLNDEDWGLMPWSTRTFEPTPQRGAIGPATYGKIFELMLRLRANTLWPAMHECTVPFFFVDGNKEKAEKYGIVISNSHAEPMLRTNTGEWNNKERGSFNFLTNEKNVLSYWEERVKELAGSENIYTVGMRGIHDGRMQGVHSLDDETSVLRRVIKEQRELLKRHNPDKDITEIPQQFVPYKEVLKAYDNGLELPEDITLVWCDDNHGYINRQSNPAEQKRSGGAGVYYHISYWGKPHDYLWLASTQPGLIYTEMKRAWNNGARRLWILNVGDIKPSEYLTEFFLDMAWDIDAFSGNTIYRHQQNWVNTVFGGAAAGRIDRILQEYYRLASHRKPEHMTWNQVEDWSLNIRGGLQPVKDTELSPFCFGDEMEQRIRRYDAIAAQSHSLYTHTISTRLKAAYYQLVHYPVMASAAMNRKILYSQKARLYARYELPAAREYAQKAQEAYHEIAALDYAYNKDLLGGKWELMMDMKPRDLPVFQAPVLPSLPSGYPGEANELLVWVENDTVPVSGNRLVLPEFSGKTGESFLLTLHAKTANPVCWETIALPEGVSIREIPQDMQYEKKLAVTYTGNTAENGIFNLVLNGTNYSVLYRNQPTGTGRFTQQNEMIAMNASGHTNPLPLEEIEGLGHSGTAVRLPVAKKLTPKSPHLEFQFSTVRSGDMQIKVGTIPMHPANPRGELRYALVIDNQKPVVVSVRAEFLSAKWAKDVLRNQALTVTDGNLAAPGEHILRLYALDEELLVDQIMIDFEKDRKHYLIPAKSE